MQRYILAFDTANEVIVVGLGALDDSSRVITPVACANIQAHRASNTKLLCSIDEVLAAQGVCREQIAAVAVGRGPGSFTGVRIAMATAKGMAQSLGVALIDVSTLDAVAWNAWLSGVRGSVLVAADAMRREIYPVRYSLGEDGPERLQVDSVVKADALVEELLAQGEKGLQIAGDALVKYAEGLSQAATLLPESLWTPTGEGLLACVQAAWKTGAADPLDAARHNPAFTLPVYTRLSDAEENERVRLAREDGGVPVVDAQGRKADGRYLTMNDTAISAERADAHGIAFKPLSRKIVAQASALDACVLPKDAWSEALLADELGRSNRVWWVALAADPALPVADDALVIGFAGGMVVDGDVQILKIGVNGEYRRKGIARELLARVVDDARNLGASTCSLEVRAGNDSAMAFYEVAGLARVGVRPRYYSDGEDAVIMGGPLPSATKDVAGMDIAVNDTVRQAASASGGQEAAGADSIARPLIFAIESSCDETAAAIVDGNGRLLADVVASQIDFHARFGGVVPEIASRKHIEAICGVCDECFDVAAKNAGVAHLGWSDMDAVAATYAPGLLGALVVGVAFAKGAAWAADVPFIGVNHLEGHLYANKIDAPDFEPPAVVSLVSGGNTLLVHMRGWGDYVTLGATIDDAVGEAFDKVAKALGLGYPGGPIISKMAAQGNPSAIAFPRAMMHSGDLRFSLSGLKTAVVQYVNAERAAGRQLNVPDICASFQAAVVDVQVSKAHTALLQTGAKRFCLGGGVAANPALRAAYENMCSKMGVTLSMPPLKSCGDNAGMIALVALDRYHQGKFFGLDADASAHESLDDPY